MTPWTPAEQVEHRRVLEAALGGPAPGDDLWRDATGRLLGPVCTPRVARPHRPRSEAAKFRRKALRTFCANCLEGCHGPDCTEPRCRCRCRAVLGLDGPFEFGDPTAPGGDSEYAA